MSDDIADWNPGDESPAPQSRVAIKTPDEWAYDALRASHARLLKALEPFAAHADRYEPDEGDSKGLAWDSTFSIGQLREARAAIAAAKLFDQPTTSSSS